MEHMLRAAESTRRWSCRTSRTSPGGMRNIEWGDGNNLSPDDDQAGESMRSMLDTGRSGDIAGSLTVSSASSEREQSFMDDHQSGVPAIENGLGMDRMDDQSGGLWGHVISSENRRLERDLAILDGPLFGETEINENHAVATAMDEMNPSLIHSRLLDWMRSQLGKLHGKIRMSRIRYRASARSERMHVSSKHSTAHNKVPNKPNQAAGSGAAARLPPFANTMLA